MCIHRNTELDCNALNYFYFSFNDTGTDVSAETAWIITAHAHKSLRRGSAPCFNRLQPKAHWLLLGSLSDTTGIRQLYMHTKCSLTGKPLPATFTVSFCVRTHANTNLNDDKWALNTASDNATTEAQSLFNLPQGHNWFVSPITQSKISIIFCNNSKNPSILSKSISSCSQPSSSVAHPSLLLCHPISTAHLRFISAPWHQLVFIPCPLHNNVPSLDLSYWLCADPAKKQRHSFALIIHVWWEAPASLLCKPRKKCLYSKCTLSVSAYSIRYGTVL